MQVRSEKILRPSKKFKTFVDNNINVTQKIEISFWKDEKTFLPVFSPLPAMFLKGLCFLELKRIKRTNPLPNNNILDSSKFKAFAHNKINVT